MPNSGTKPKRQYPDLYVWTLADVLERAFTVYVNLDNRRDREEALDGELFHAAIWADGRQPGIVVKLDDDGKPLHDLRGYKQPTRYACGLAKRLAVRQMRKSGHQFGLLLEDDVVFSRDFIEKSRRVILPPDWEVLFLGCRHVRPPSPPDEFYPNVVDVTQAFDNHAVLIRDRAFNSVIKGLQGFKKGAPPTIDFCDGKLSKALWDLRTYAVWPNLAWQRTGYSDGAGGKFTGAYDANGNQRIQTECVAHLKPRTHP